MCFMFFHLYVQPCFLGFKLPPKQPTEAIWGPSWGQFGAECSTENSTESDMHFCQSFCRTLGPSWGPGPANTLHSSASNLLHDRLGWQKRACNSFYGLMFHPASVFLLCVRRLWTIASFAHSLMAWRFEYATFANVECSRLYFCALL